MRKHKKHMKKRDFSDETNMSKDAITYHAIKHVFDSIIAPGKGWSIEMLRNGSLSFHKSNLIQFNYV